MTHQLGLSGAQLYRMIIHGAIRYFIRNPEANARDSHRLKEVSGVPELTYAILTSIRYYNKAPWACIWEIGQCCGSELLQL